MAEHINTKEDVTAYLEAALEENDTALLFAVIGDIARSNGMARIANICPIGTDAMQNFLRNLCNNMFGIHAYYSRNIQIFEKCLKNDTLKDIIQ